MLFLTYYLKTNMKIGRVVLFIFYFLTCISLNGQQYNFEKINHNNGFYSSTVNCMMSDSEERLIFGCDGAGLFIHDGAQFHNYNKFGSIENFFITDIVEIKKRQFFITTKYSGMLFFNGDKFSKRLDLKNIKPPFEKLAKNKQGILAFSSKNIILTDFDLNLKKKFSFTKDISDINSVVQLSENTYLIGTKKGGYLYDFTTNVLKSYGNYNDYITYCNGLNNRVFSGNNDGEINEIYIQGDEIKNNKITTVTKNNIKVPILKILQNKNNNIWFLSKKEIGIGVVFNRKFTSLITQKNGLPVSDYNCIAYSKGIINVGTNGNGFFQFTNQSFINYNSITQLNDSNLFSMLINDNDLYIYSRSSSGINHLKTLPFNGLDYFKTYSVNSCNQIILSFENELINCAKDGVYVLRNGIFIKKLDYHCMTIKKVGDKYLLGTVGNGLLLLDKDFNVIFKLPQFNDLFEQVNNINLLDKNKFLIGFSNGLYLVELFNDSIKVKTKITKDFTFLTTKDGFGNFWYSAESKVLFVNKKLQTKEYTTEKGLASSLIYTLQAHKNYIFIGTNKSLDKYELDKNGKIVKIDVINATNGFDGIETNYKSSAIDKKGNIYFGTVNGLYKYLNTREKDKSTNKIKILNITLNNTEKFDVNNENSISEFDAYQGDINFQIGHTGKLITEKVYYSYQLVNYNKEWSKPTLSKNIQFYRLNSGLYKFQVREVDQLGNPLGLITTYTFLIKEPFYSTWWFFSIIIIFLGILLNFFFQKSSTYNKEFVSEIGNNNFVVFKKIHLFYIGFVIGISQIIFFLFNIISQHDFFVKIFFCILCISSYFLSNYKIISKNLNLIYIGLYLTVSIYLLHSFNKENISILNISEYLILIFFGSNIYNQFKHYMIYMLVAFITLVSFYILFNYNKDVYLTLIIATIIIFIINYSRRIQILNTSDKLMFSNKIINNSNTLTIACDKFGKIKFVSASVEKLIGFKPEEIIDTYIWDISIDDNFYKGDFNEIYKPNFVRTLRILSKNNEVKYYQFSEFKFSDDLFVANGQDITQKVTVEAQYENLVNFASDIIYEVNNQGNFTFINPFGVNSMGRMQHEIIGKSYLTFVAPSDKQRVEEFYKDVKKNQNEFETIEFEAIRRDGGKIWLSQKVTIKRDEHNKVSGFFAIARDITKSVESQSKEIERKARLERFNKTLNILTSKNYVNFNSIDLIIKDIFTIVFESIRVDQLSYWKNHMDRIELECIFDRDRLTPPDKFVFYKKDSIDYFESIYNQKHIEINSFEKFPQETIFISEYVKIFEIKSLLDFPLYLQGELVGIVCFETTVEEYDWDDDEINFARSISDILALAIESFNRKIAEEQAVYKSNILIEISKITENLLVNNDLSHIFTNSNSIIFNTIKADRFYYFENDENNLLSQKYFWDPNYDDENQNGGMIKNLPHDAFPKSAHIIKENKIFKSKISELEDESFKATLIKYKIKSLLVIPVFKKDKFSGFIGFDDCKYERDWSTEEITTLQTLANNISSTLVRIDNEKTLRESEEKFRLLANNMPATIYLVRNDENKEIVFINDEISKLTGYKKSEILDPKFSFGAIYHPDDHELVNESIYKALSQNKPYKFECRIITKSGEEVWVEEYGEGIEEDGEIIYIEGVIVDISERKQIENALIEKELAIASNKSKSEFLANMSHEIRTPLNGIIGFSNLLLNSEVNETQKNYIYTVNQSAEALLEIVNDILDISKIEAGKLILESKKVDLHALIYQVMDMIKFNAYNKNLELILSIEEDVPSFIHTDEIRLKQILINLMSNAIKFTHVGEIILSIKSITNDKDAFIKFEVIDTGIGIKDENKEKILEAFSQEDTSTTRNYGGTGLGLSISNSLIKLMGSSLYIQSKVNVGSTFGFTLKTKCENEEIEYKEIRNLDAVYILENNKSQRMVIQKMFEHFSIESKIIKSTEDLLLISENSIVIIDFNSIKQPQFRKTIELQKQKNFILFILQKSLDDNLELYNTDRIKTIIKPLKNKIIFKELTNILSGKKEAINFEATLDSRDIAIKVMIVEDNKVNMLLTKTLVKKQFPKATIVEAENGEVAILTYKENQPDLILMDIQMPIMNGYQSAEKILEINPSVRIIALTAGVFKGEKEKCIEIGMVDFLVKPLDKDQFNEKLLKWVIS